MRTVLFLSALCVLRTAQFGSLFQYPTSYNYQSSSGYPTAPVSYQPQVAQQYAPQTYAFQQQYAPQQYAQPTSVYHPQSQFQQPAPVYHRPQPQIQQPQYIARPAIPQANYFLQQSRVQSPQQSYLPQQQQIVPQQRPQKLSEARPQPVPQPKTYIKPTYAKPQPQIKLQSYAKPVPAPQEYVAPPPPAYEEPPVYVRPDPCFTNNHGYRCCDKDLESMMNDFQIPGAVGCNHQKMANQLQHTAQSRFNTSFESIVSPSEFEGHHNFIGNLMCKTKTSEGKIMLLYATAIPYTIEGSNRPLTKEEIDRHMWSSEYLEIKST